MYRPWVLVACILIVECHGVTCGRLSSNRFRNCLQFSRCLPSRWELEWLRNAHKRQKAICETIDSEKPNSKIWLEGVLDPALIHINMTEASDLHFNESVDAVWPLYIYHDTCSWKREDIYVPIEPVVGLLRNPMATPCSSGLSALDVQDRDYLLVATKTLTNHYTGKKLLFDLGTGDSFQSSLSWFVEKYHDRGVEFDEIWAWEAEQTNSHQYWQSVPDSYVSRLHFYNTFASDQRSLSSPIGIIERQFRSGDFVVIKLDIDNENLENNIMNEIMNIRHMVGELFFEKHFDAVEMHPYFGALNITYSETLAMFNDFRNAGVRLHYWP